MQINYGMHHQTLKSVSIKIFRMLTGCLPGDTLFSLGPHADDGSLERWEDPEYSKCYEPIFEGRWEDHEPYDATHRIGADMNLHESIGNCSIFRTFQAFLSLSETEPNKGGMKFAPSVKLVTAYYMLNLS